MKKGFKSGLIVLIIMVAVVIGAVGIVTSKAKKSSDSTGFNFSSEKGNNGFSFSVGNGKNTVSTTKKGNPTSKQYIAELYIEGTIQEANNSYNQKWLLEAINFLKEDKNNAGIAIFINSPGGAVYQADEAYLALQDYKTTGKKIYVYQGPMAASGGYYISCAGDEIWANRNTMTGCIGVLCGQSIDLTQMFDKMGIKMETIHSGKNKNMGNYDEPFTDEQRAIMQSICDECYEQFVSIVATQRNMTYEEAAKLADGRIYTAKQGLENGLIDQIDTFEGMKDALAANVLDDVDNYNTRIFKYEKKQNFVNMMMGKISDIKKTEAASRLGLPEAVWDDINGFNDYPAYLYK